MNLYSQAAQSGQTELSVVKLFSTGLVRYVALRGLQPRSPIPGLLAPTLV
jgi:hypothetical protein